MTFLKGLRDGIVSAWDAMLPWQRYLVVAVWVAAAITALTRL